MPEPSLKNQAQEIIVAVDHDLQEVESKTLAIQDEVTTKANTIMDTIFRVVSDVDLKAAAARVEALKEEYPEASPEELSKKLIRDKCQRTGTVGAVTSGAGLIPGIGTAAAVTLGVVADIGTTFKLQAELVLEIASLYEYPLTEEEKQRLVMAIIGLSAGSAALAHRAGQRAAIKVSEKFAEKSIIKALPVVGIIASAGTNVLSTYIIGQRADAYFRLGPEAVGSWSDSLRAITGVDERNITSWLAESGKNTGAAIVSGAGKVGEAGKAAGEAITSGAGRTAEAVSTRAKMAGETAHRGLKAYLRWVVLLWTTIFSTVWKILVFIWLVISFIPRRVIHWFKQRNM
jgi:hypothetical protein